MSVILIVESDAIFGGVLEDSLRAEGHMVELLLDMNRASAVATELAVDLLIFEVSQPRAVGLEVVRRLRERNATSVLPILVISDSAESADRVAALRAGADDYLTKPFDLEELLLRSERLLSRHTVAAPVLQGDLSSYPIWELVQYLQQARKGGNLVLRGTTGNGAVNLGDGVVVSAKWEKLRGREALLAVFGLKRGTFRFVSASGDDRPPTTTEGIEVEQVLMQAAWLEDELHRRRQFLPPTGAPLKDTGKPEVALEESLEAAELPVAQVRQLVSERSGVRIFDLIRKLPRAPQIIRLAVACLFEQGVLLIPEGSEREQYPSTGEIATSLLVEMAVSELLVAARQAGFGTSALPYLVLVEPAHWDDLIHLLGLVPGYYRNETLRSFVEQLRQRHGGSVRLPSDAGKLSLHIRMLSEEICARVEQLVTISAGVLLWVEKADEEQLIRRVLSRLEEVKAEATGTVVSGEEARPTMTRLLEGTRRWRLTPHAPQTLVGMFRLLQPVGEDDRES